MSKYTRNQYILVVIDYVAIWVKAKMAQTNKIIVITKFLYKCILICFGCFNIKDKE